MATILCYGDSLTWGAVPNGGRLIKKHRWTELLDQALEKHQVINLGLPGRTTVWDDPFREGRNGSQYIQAALEIFGPVNIVVLMLGTNDLKRYFNAGAYEAAQGIEQLIHKIREPNPHHFPNPKILVVAPPNILSPKGELAEMYHGAVEKSQNLHQHYQRIATKHHCGFLNAAGIINPSELDGVHLDIEGNRLLSEAIIPIIETMIST
jgi:lysophospholipase L1-like esterase